MHSVKNKRYWQKDSQTNWRPIPQMDQSSSAYPLGVLPEPWSESSASGMANPFLRIPEIKVAGKTNLLRSRDRRRAEKASAEPEKRKSLPLAKLIVLAGCVSLLAALLLASRTDFQPDIIPFQARVAIFMVRYTMPICFFQLGAFWILYLIRRR
jgi:hypothetical protein